MIIFIGALILMAPFALGAFFRKKARDLRYASRLWATVEQPARILLEDRRLDPVVADFVENLLGLLGRGTMARLSLCAFMLTLFRRKAKWRSKPQASELSIAVDGLHKDQSTQFFRFMVSALFFDSFNSPLAGPVVRRSLYWLGATVRDKRAPVSLYEIEPVMKAVDKHCLA